jgi:hypothetical protein
VDDLTSFTKSKPNNFTEETKVFLKYKDQKNLTELLPSTVYVFNITASTTNNESRFSLLFRAPNASTGIENAENGNTLVFVNTQNQITIIAPKKCNYAIYNAVGQVIENGVFNAKYITLNSKCEAGVYVVKVNNQSTRIIVK